MMDDMICIYAACKIFYKYHITYYIYVRFVRQFASVITSSVVLHMSISGKEVVVSSMVKYRI